MLKHSLYALKVPGAAALVFRDNSNQLQKKYIIYVYQLAQSGNYQNIAI